VKCDEGKPHCERCVTTGRKCDGYELEPYKPEDISRSTSCTLTRSPSLEILGNEKERRSFHFFLTRTAPQLSAFYGEPFWNKLVLQASHYEPSIRHAITALGSLHERFENEEGFLTRSNTDQRYNDSFALQEYGLAIQALVQPFSRNEPQAIDVCLTSCILFACFEVSSYTWPVSQV
jgi:hypothetical protein